MPDLTFSEQVLIGAGTILASLGTAYGIVKTTVAGLVKRVDKNEENIVDLYEKHNAFKLEATKTFVSAEALGKIEGKMEAGFDAIRQELRDTNQTIVSAILSNNTQTNHRQSPPRQNRPRDV